MVAESTKIRVFSVTPFKINFDNVIDFKSEEAQLEFFSHDSAYLKCFYKSDSFQFLDRDGSVYVSGRMPEFEKATYMMFWNENRWYYAFVLDCAYVNEGTTELIYELDLWNTYQNDLRQKKITGYVERAILENSLNNCKLGLQGFDIGTKKPVYVRGIGATVEWLVIIGKPSINLGDNAPALTFSGVQKNLKYYVAPINPTKKRTYELKVGDITIPAMDIHDLFKLLAGKMDNLETESGDKIDNKDIVNQIVNMYYTKNIGVNYKLDGETIEIIGDNLQGTEAKLGVKVKSVKQVKSSGGGNGGAVIDEGDVSTVDGRLKALTQAIKANVPNATAQGIAAVAGCFMVESSIVAGTYETDYITGYDLNKMRSECTAENLMGSWIEFYKLYNYTGLYEQGYLADDGKHWIGAGLGQWTGPRCKALWEFASNNGLDPFSFNAQIKFMLIESRADVFNEIVTSGLDVNSLTADFLARWEGVPGNKLGQRQDYANQFLPTIQGYL